MSDQEPTSTPNSGAATVEATIERPADERGLIALRLDDGQRLLAPAEHVRVREDGRATLTLDNATSRVESLRQRDAAGHTVADGEQVIPVLAERLDVSTRKIETGRVILRKTIREEQQAFEQPLLKEEVEVDRVNIEQFIDEPLAPRHEGETLVIPVMEEVLVVEKRLMLREEVRVTRKRTERVESRVETVRREDVEVRRSDAAGPA